MSYNRELMGLSMVRFCMVLAPPLVRKIALISKLTLSIGLYVFLLKSVHSTEGHYKMAARQMVGRGSYGVQLKIF